jgi:hypothetical protein
MKTDMMQLLLDIYEFLDIYHAGQGWKTGGLELQERVSKAMNELEEL